ncbi:hypothetical protein EXIGLDRAFT_527944 [Exidia glandulosa HHB12029]|uniref:Uncharacterized protein n=1 Tax=Exidia glandulosa HHB12029 TaxID=1314781 RepID=A0A165IYP5_EXIGL|nr:hypothetical protein EXIGLDRAFT_527944 [Exidia glandulosa HHB12029]
MTFRSDSLSHLYHNRDRRRRQVTIILSSLHFTPLHIHTRAREHAFSAMNKRRPSTWSDAFEPPLPTKQTRRASAAFAKLAETNNLPGPVVQIFDEMHEVVKKLGAATWNKSACASVQARLEQLAALINHNHTVLVTEFHNTALNAATNDFQRCLKILQDYVARQQGLSLLRALIVCDNGKTRLALVNMALKDALNTYELRLAIVNFLEMRMLKLAQDTDETNQDAHVQRMLAIRMRNQLQVDILKFREREAAAAVASTSTPPATISRSRTAVSRTSARYSPKSLIFGRGLKLRMRRDAC